MIFLQAIIIHNKTSEIQQKEEQPTVSSRSQRYTKNIKPHQKPKNTMTIKLFCSFIKDSWWRCEREAGRHIEQI